MSVGAGALHILATLGALSWAGHERRELLVPESSWRLSLGASLAALLGDALLVLAFPWRGLLAAAYTVALILGCAVLILSLLQGWPSRALLVVAMLSVIAPLAVAL